MATRLNLLAVPALVVAALLCAPAHGADTVGVAAFLGDVDFKDFDGEAAVVISRDRSWDMNEELMTPRIDCTGRTGATVTWHHGYRSRTGQFVDVLVTLDGGSTFKVIYGDGVSSALCPGVCVSTSSGTVHNDTVTVDVSSIADGQPDVRVAFRYYGDQGTDVPSANDDWYWAIEDVAVTTNEGEVFREGFDTPTPFDDADCADAGQWCVLDDGDPEDEGPLSTWYWGTATALPDGCEPSGNDCNENGVPDECELVDNDCNANGVPDECDVASGTSTDCNRNGRPDRCEMAVGVTTPDGPGLCTEDCEIDCNGNGVPDTCDVDDRPVTYDMPNGQTLNELTYWDEKYGGDGDTETDGAALSDGLGQLVDGKTGADDPAADLGDGAGYEWVGWNNAQPTITFDFGRVANFETVSIHSNNVQTDGIGLFGSVELTFSDDGTNFGDLITYTTTAEERADTSAQLIEITIPQDARYVRAQFQEQAGYDWILISEISFTVQEADCNGNGRPDSCDFTDETFEATGLPTAVPPTAGGETTEVSLVVPMSSRVEGLIVTLDITHPSVHDLTATLVSPGGAEIVLFDHIPAVGQDFSDTVFDDEATESINDGEPPFTGVFRPDESLGALVGASTRGTWTLRVVDDETGDVGTINRFALNFAASPDCDANGLPDACDIADCPDPIGLEGQALLAALACQDCNANGIPDECDLAEGTSLDCNGNNVPDACDVEDPSGAVQPVAYDMPNGQTLNELTYWDEPYDGDGDAEADAAALSDGLGQLVDGTVGTDDPTADLGDGDGYEWVGWNDIQPAITLDFGKTTRFKTVSIHNNNAQTDGIGLFGSVELTFSDDGSSFGDMITYTTTTEERDDTSAQFIYVDVPRTARHVRAQFQDQAGYPWILISEIGFTAREPDCDEDGVPDECQLTDNDCNGNAVPDNCEPDCDEDGEPDECEISSGASLDCNENDIPDDCELDGNDCNENNVPDECDISSDTSTDCNQNTLPDECEIDENSSAPGAPFFCTENCEPDCNENGMPDACDLSDEPLVYDMLNGQTYRDEPYNGDGDAGSDGAALSGGVGQLVDGDVGANDPAADLGSGGGYEWVGWNGTQPTITFDFGRIARLEAVSIHSNNAQTGGIGLFGSVDLTFSNDGSTFGDTTTYTTTAEERADTTARFIEIAIPQDARYVRAQFQEQAGFTWILLSELKFAVRDTDCDDDDVPDACQLTDNDCDGNLVPDQCDPDCDDDGKPDACEITDGDATDCNDNGVPDECDIASGDSTDCNGNGVPDKCELTDNDCNTNTVPDDCDIAAGTSSDDNDNGIPDECESP